MAVVDNTELTNMRMFVHEQLQQAEAQHKARTLKLQQVRKKKKLSRLRALLLLFNRYAFTTLHYLKK